MEKIKRITLGHGSGGRLTRELIRNYFLEELGNPSLSALDDSALLNIGEKDVLFSTDSYVVNPIFFPGGDIGRLSVCGTVNDLAVCGAKPLYLSAGIIMEEGFEMRILDKVVASIKAASRQAGVSIVAGDTKVVEKGACDKIFINTSGIGIKPKTIKLILDDIRAGDRVIVSGPIGRHGVSILIGRQKLNLRSKVKSDCAPLNRMLSKVLKHSRDIRFMRDPTRGGLATALNEFVEGRKLGVLIDEESIPITEGVKSACELLGFDPLYMANEGIAVIITSKGGACRILKTLKSDPSGSRARVIGEVTKEYKGRVCMKTKAGGLRLLRVLSGEQLPRIC